MNTEVAIIGAGPVGLLLARLLQRRGVTVVVFEKAKEKKTWSQAIGITPPSLDILAELGLAAEFVRRGVRIEDCHIHGQSGHVGTVSFREIDGAFPFVLALPQVVTMELLEKDVNVMRGEEVAALHADASGVLLRCMSGLEVFAQRVAACDGSHSVIREMLGIRTCGKSYGCHFVMGDFRDESSLNEEAHVFFTASGAVESFPLPNGLRRWIVQTADRSGSICEMVRERTGFLLTPEDQIDQHAFSPRRLDCNRLVQGPVVLCGDAGHVMSPIGGQGMNCGFGDAAMLAKAWSGEGTLQAYDEQRRRVAAAAASRAALGMWLGTRTGLLNCVWREALFHLMTSPWLGRHAAAWFTMRSLPT